MARLTQSGQKTIFVHGPPAGVRLLLFAALSVALMAGDHRHDQLDYLRGTLSVLIYPLQQAVNVPERLVGWLAEEVTSREDLQRENRRLRQKQFLTSAQIQKLNVLEAENRRLRRLLDSAAHLPERAIIAELLNVASDPYRHQIVVSKGTTQGTYVGQPILDANGVVGQIMHTGPASSVGVLVTDPSHALPVQVDRNGIRAIVLGTGRYGELVLPYIPNNADVRPGDLLITSGLGGRFPRGYPVARVAEVTPDPGRPFARIIARPTTQLDRIREVLLLMPLQPETSEETDNAEETGSENLQALDRKKLLAALR